MDDLSAKHLINAIPLPALVIGKGDGIDLANEAAIDLLGPQIQRAHFMTVLRQPSLIAAIESARAGGQKQIAFYVTTDAGKDVNFDVHITPNSERLVLSFVDRSNAEDLDAFRRDFVANVSHELRTPLASLLGFIETLRGPAKDDSAAQDRFLGIMESEAQRMSQLVDDLLSLSRVEESARKRPTTALVLGDLVAQAVTELAPVIEASGAQVQIEDQSAGCAVLADAGQMRQVIANLVQNALRYGDEKGQVTIALTKPTHEPRLFGTGVRLSVRDQGPGIAAHHLPRLAERFYRVDSHRARDVGGTGLGLAIVKHIVQRHRGHLLIESTLGKGSVFTVILPQSAENS